MYLNKIISIFSYIIIILLGSCCSIQTSKGQGLTAELFGGTSFSLPTPLRIEQPGEATIQFRARYRTRPWHGSPYYAYRLGYRNWQVELIHHKVYLQNPSPEIQHFEVSHGYNLALVSRSFPRNQKEGWFRVGVGLVVGHPEGQIRGKAINPVRSWLGGGYHISGVAWQAAIGPQLGMAKHWFIRPEIKITGAWAQMPLSGGGKAQVPNLALHTLLGIGYRGLQ